MPVYFGDSHSTCCESGAIMNATLRILEQLIRRPVKTRSRRSAQNNLHLRRPESLEPRVVLSSVSVSPTQIAFVADAGDVNTLIVSEAGGVLTIEDTTSTINSVSAEFTVLSPNAVSIPVAGFSIVNLTLLDGNDTLDASGLTAASGLRRTNIQGGGGDDTLIGSGLDDFFIEETGNDFIDGGTAISSDQWTIRRDANMVLVDGVLTINGTETDQYTNIEVVSLTGGASNNILDASAATPASGITGLILNGVEGDDTLIGGSTRDIFQDRLGANTFDGGGGTNDSIFFLQDVDMSATDLTVTADGNTSSHVGIERIDLWGGAGDNIIDVSGITAASSFTSIQIQGFDGNDTLIGSSLPDTIRDSGGVNVLDGGGARDILITQTDTDQVLANSTISIDGQISSHSNFEDIRLVGGNSDNLLDASALDASSGVDFVSLQGLDGNDTLLGSQVVDEIRTLGGNNTIDGGGSPSGTRDRVVFFQDLDMTATDTSVIVGTGVNTLNDVEDLRLIGNASDNTLDASRLTLASGVELLIISGSGGNDTIVPTADSNLPSSVDGGAGSDMLDLSHSLATPVINVQGAGTLDGERGSYTTGGVFSSFNNVDSIILPAEYDFAAASTPIVEGDSTAITNAVQINRSVNTSIASSVDIILTPATGNTGDVAATAITVNFQPGETTRSVPIEILGDQTVELDETFSLSFANGIAGVSQPVSALVIENDDSAGIQITDVTQTETDSMSVAFEFNVSLSHPIDIPVSLKASTSDATATAAGGDYDAIDEIDVEFPAGTTQSQTLTVFVNGDTVPEANETFLVVLDMLQSNGRDVVLDDPQGIGTIVDDDVTATPPEIVSVVSDATFESKGTPEESVNVTVEFNDENVDDTHTVTVDWGDGTINTHELNVGARTFTGSHDYTSGGIFEISVVITDSTEADQTASQAVVSGTRLTSEGVLQIVGTDLADRVQINRRRGNIRVRTRTNNGDSATTTHSRSDVNAIEIYTCDGNDRIRIDHRLNIPATIDAGAGNDSIVSGSGDDLIRGGSGNDWIDAGNGNNVVLGGAGHDLISAWSGRDILIGGTGCDIIWGGAGQDILIGGSTIHDASDEALNAIRNEWTSNKSFATRRNNLSNGSGGNGQNGSVFLGIDEVIDDEETDFLFGGFGRDWYPEFI